MKTLTQAILAVPAGRWAVGVSGGADSVALLRLMADRRDCELVVAHLDHELRGEESDADAAFVERLVQGLNLPIEIGRRSAMGVPIAVEVNNPSARYRAARFAFFKDVVRRHNCRGVLLAHHADDQAETVLLRLRRGRGMAGLGGMAAVTTIDGLVVCRPLLNVRRDTLRQYLADVGQPWREDASNASPKYRRNALRQWLTSGPLSRYPGGGLGRGPATGEFQSNAGQTPSQTLPREYKGEGTRDLVPALLRLAKASTRWRNKLDAESPQLAESFEVAALAIPWPFAEHALRRWLIARGSPPDRVSPAVCRQLFDQATDPTKPPRQHYPGGLLIRRRQKRIDVIPSPPVQSRTTHGQETPRTEDL